MVRIKTIKQKRLRRLKLGRLRILKQKPLPGGKKRRKVARKAIRRIEKAFPVATLPLR